MDLNLWLSATLHPLCNNHHHDIWEIAIPTDTKEPKVASPTRTKGNEQRYLRLPWHRELHRHSQIR